ncbi:O-methyltransferase [Adhaeribacter aquaticus]|uniref:O-methyltransferase n=1 Tax=Adhaeribacter aquaticus TaxID=299567 RepID=UPI0003F4CBB6|nr:class I SAM-dependent methyltransferase [Adhaeribacter aquaticus]
MQLIRFAYKYLIYRLKSFRLHGVHSPFVFDLYNQVICHDGEFEAYSKIEAIREELLQNETIISVTDFGAGSRSNSGPKRKIKEIALKSAKPTKYAQLLFRLVNYFQPSVIIELGTSLGLTTAYLAAARKKAKIYTLEGCPNLVKEAQQNFTKLQLSPIQVITGNIDHTLPEVINSTKSIDFVFFDGNHRYEPTMRYFHWCLEKSNENSVLVFDDIYWSEEMEKAWKEICQHPAVTISIDLFQIGLIFFRKKQPKQHFTIYY